MGKKLRTTVGDLADELRKRGMRERALLLDPYRHIGSLSQDSDELVRMLADMIEGRR